MKAQEDAPDKIPPPTAMSVEMHARIQLPCRAVAPSFRASKSRGIQLGLIHTKPGQIILFLPQKTRRPPRESHSSRTRVTARGRSLQGWRYAGDIVSKALSPRFTPGRFKSTVRSVQRILSLCEPKKQCPERKRDMSPEIHSRLARTF